MNCIYCGNRMKKPLNLDQKYHKACWLLLISENK